MQDQLNWIIFNASLYCAWALYYLWKKGFSVVTWPMLLWALSSLSSIVYFTSDYRSYSFEDKITLLPFVYLFILIWISFIPLIKFDYNKVEEIKVNLTLFKYISFLIILLSLITIIPNIKYFVNNMLSPSAYLENYEDKMAGIRLKILTGFPGIIMRYLKYMKGIIPIFFIFSYTKFVKSSVFLRAGLALALINLFINYLNASSRFALLTDLLLIVFVYHLLLPYIDKKTKKIVNIVGLFIGGILFSGVALITLSRFGDDSGYSKTIDYTISRYFGESFLNFNGDMWNMRSFAEGHNCFAYFIDRFNGKTYPGRDYEFLETLVHRRMSVYYTFVGDYFTDYGAWGAAIMVIVLALIFRKITVSKSVTSIGTMMFLIVYVKVLLLGYTYWTYLNYSMEFVVTIFVGMLFNKTSMRQQNTTFKRDFRRNDFNSNGHV